LEPILSKQEIADLLTAIRDGRISIELDRDAAGGQFLDSTPVNLFQLARSTTDQGRFPNFDIILDAFSRNYSISLTNLLQRSFTVTRKTLDIFHFQQYLTDKTKPAAIGILNLTPLKHGALMIFDPKLSFSLIEIMLGASPDLGPLKLDRELTTIELNILKTAFSGACNDLNRAFTPILHLESSLLKVENNARLVSITEPDAEILVVAFVMRIGEFSGEFDLIFPISSLEPLKVPLKELVNINANKKSNWRDQIEEDIKELTTTIIAQSGVVNIPVNKILSLKKGDILDIDYDPNTPLKVLVEDTLKFFARPGTHNGKKAISLTGVYEQGA
jgi:flagellar motor switch protein FliM